MDRQIRNRIRDLALKIGVARLQIQNLESEIGAHKQQLVEIFQAEELKRFDAGLWFVEMTTWKDWRGGPDVHDIRLRKTKLYEMIVHMNVAKEQTGAVN